MAQQQPGGGEGGAGGHTPSVTRIKVLDPHILITLRDIMEATDTGTTRLNPNAGSGGGGGGGGASYFSSDANPGSAGTAGTAQTRTITNVNGAVGGKGRWGLKNVDPLIGDIYYGGGGAGGAGGNGGALVIISTTATGSRGTCQANGGAAESDGLNGNNNTPNPSAGNAGEVIHMEI